MEYLSYICPIRVRYADTDKMGFVYNGNYLTYFEVGRTELMRHFGLIYSELEKAGYQLPLLESYAKYRQPAFYDDLLEIEAKLMLNGGATIKFEYRILRKEDVITSGFTVHSFINIENKKPVKPPKIFTEGVERALAKIRELNIDVI
ncbi:MAG: acyl-CoA thioesterase [Chloroflexota bacterium]